MRMEVIAKKTLLFGQYYTFATSKKTEFRASTFSFK